jgi:hypothetical protein
VPPRNAALAVAAFLVLAPAFLAARAGAQDERPQLSDVSAVRIANYGMPSTVIADRKEVNAIVGELRQLRGKPWRRGEARISCYATLVLLRGERPLALFRVSPDLVVERPQGKGQRAYSLSTEGPDLPQISSLLAAIPPPKNCI